MVKVISSTTAALLLVNSYHQHIIGVTGSEVSSVVFPNEYYYTYDTTEEEQTIEKGEDISRDTFVTSQVHVDTDTRYYDDDTVTSATRPPKSPTITSADGDGDSWGGSGKTSEQTSEDMSMKQSWWSGSGKSGKSGSRYDYDCDEWGTSKDHMSMHWWGGKSGKSGYSSSSSSGSWGSTSGDYMMSMPPKTMMTSEDDGSSWRSLRSDTWEGSSSSSVMPPKTMMTSEDDGQQWGGSSHSMPNTSNDSWGEWKPKSAKAFSKGGKSGGWWPEKDHSMSMHSWGSGKSGKSGSKCGKVRDREVYISYA